MQDSTFGGIIVLVGCLSILWGAFDLVNYKKGDGRAIVTRIFGGLGIVAVGLILKHFNV